MIMSKHLFTPQIDENLYLNTTHRVNLTGGEISTILNYLKEICEGPKVDRIYAELQSVTDNYYAQLEEQSNNNYAECVDHLVSTMGANPSVR